VYKKQCQPAASDGSQTAPVHINIGNAGASFSWDVVDPAVLTQDIYAAFAIQHGYMRVNATRTSLHIQVGCCAVVYALCPALIAGCLHRPAPPRPAPPRPAPPRPAPPRPTTTE